MNKSKINKLKIFSAKLNSPMNLCFSGDGIIQDSNILYSWANNGWSNTSDCWLNDGWNNSSSGWTDKGWCNSGGNWLDNGWSNSGSSWTDNGWNNSGGCYITTACVEHMGLTDNCYELETMRYYRDILIKNDSEFREKILEYYRKAPIIVRGIMDSDNKEDILDDLYYNLVKKCVEMLEKGNLEKAKEYYISYYEYLANIFI